MGLSLFCYFQVGLVWEAHHRRALPPEPDDAYYYIFKTVQLRECFRQDCAALNDLRPQLTPSPGDSPSRAWKKWRLFHGFLVDYHPFYSLVLLLLSQVQGISLELAFWQLCLLGSLGLALTIAALLLTLTDVATAGVAMATLALTVFPGQGIHYIVPSNLTMGLGILMFVHLLRRDGRPGLLFYALNLGALGMHPTGLIYSGLGIMIFQRIFNRRVFGKSSYSDWLLLVAIGLLTLSGTLVELARFGNWEVAYHIYFFHLVSVWFVIMYLPYTKLGHVFFRTTALLYARSGGRK